MTVALMPTVMNPRDVDYLERQIGGGLILANREQRRPVLALLKPEDFTTPASRALVGALLYAEEHELDANQVTIPDIATKAGYIRAKDRGRMGVFVSDLVTPESTLGPVALTYAYSLIEASSRRKAREHLERLSQAAETVPSDEWENALQATRDALSDLTERLERAATV